MQKEFSLPCNHERTAVLCPFSCWYGGRKTTTIALVQLTLLCANIISLDNATGFFLAPTAYQSSQTDK